MIEDCCESHGATFDGQKIGTVGDMSNFSFYFGHHMTTIEGGMISTDNEEIYELISNLKQNLNKKNMKLEQFSNPDFEVGEKVQHKEFGLGIILGISEKKLQIRFENSNEVIKVFSDFVSKL